MNFPNYEEALSFIQRREGESGERFVTIKSRKGIGESELPEKLSDKRIYWNDAVPHIKMGRKVYACANGKERKTQSRKKDHAYERKQRGRSLLGTTKLGCPAKMVIDELIEFPDYKITKVTKNLKDRTVKKMAKDKDDGRYIRIERIIRVSFDGHHEGHLIGKITGLPQRIDSRVAKAIQNMAKEGVTSPTEVSQRLTQNMKDIVKDVTPEPGNLRYFPSNRTISQHLCRNKKRNQAPEDPQETLEYMEYASVTRVVPSALVAYAVRLTPGEELVSTLAQFVSHNNLQAAFVLSCVGSVTKITLRMADSQTINTYEGPFEIVSLVGTLSAGGHLHGSFSDAEGRVFGGHIVSDAVVYTTVELVIGDCSAVKFTREHDVCSGYRELVVTETTPNISK